MAKRNSPAAAAVVAPAPTNEPASSRTLVISGVSDDMYKALMIRTFKNSMENDARISVSSTVRDIVEEWYRREGAGLLAAGK